MDIDVVDIVMSRMRRKKVSTNSMMSGMSDVDSRVSVGCIDPLPRIPTITVDDVHPPHPHAWDTQHTRVDDDGVSGDVSSLQQYEIDIMKTMLEKVR